MSNDIEEKKNPPTPKTKGLGLTGYITIAIVTVVVLSFLVEIYGAFTEGRPLNLELVNKLLDTLTNLLSTPAPVPAETP